MSQFKHIFSVRRVSILRVGLLLATLGSGAAWSQSKSGWYVAGTVGAASQGDRELVLSGSPNLSRSIGLDPGLFAGGSFGYEFATGWRVETDFAYQSSDYSNVDFGTGRPSGSGNYASTSVALSALYQFNLLGSEKVRSYLGVGVARLTEVDIDIERAGTELSYSGSDTGLQWQLGARYDLSERTFLDVGFRQLLAKDVRLEQEGGTGVITADYKPWSATVSFGFRF